MFNIFINTIYFINTMFNAFINTIYFVNKNKDVKKYLK